MGFFVKEDKLTVENILIAHKILMHGKLPIDERGHFRKCAVYVGRYEGKPYGKISELMTHWIKNANDVVVNGQKENEAFLEKIIKEHHVIFESIHPFIDGNGRIGRLIMNWQRVKVGLPILVILEKEKQDYYKWFK